MGRPDLPGGASRETGEVPPDRRFTVWRLVGVIDAPTPTNAAHIAAQDHGPGQYRCEVDDLFGSAKYQVQV